MDPDIVKAKLESLSRCIARIESKAPESARDLMGDPDAQDIIALNLERSLEPPRRVSMNAPRDT